MIAVINAVNGEIKFVVSGDLPQILQEGEIQLSVKDVYLQNLILSGSIVRYDFEKKEFQVIEKVLSTPEKVNHLEDENAELWYDTMLKDARISEQDNDIADLWYEIMTGGAI